MNRTNRWKARPGWERRICVAAALIGMSACMSGCPRIDACPECDSVFHDGLKRDYLLHLPPSYDGSVQVPLLLVFHGANSTPVGIRDLTGFDEVADREGFIVAYPKGLEKQWNDARGVPFGPYPVALVDDVGFVVRLIDKLAFRYAIDRRRIYAAGFSNGGMMVQRLGCELPSLFAAAAAVSGPMPEYLYQGCSPSLPLSFLMIDSQNDPMIPWRGGDIRLAFFYLGRVVSVMDTVSRWATLDGCSPTPVVTLEPDRDPMDGARVWREVYSGGVEDTEVVLFRILGAGHSWPGGRVAQDGLIPGRICRDIDAAEVIWSFCKDKRRSR